MGKPRSDRSDELLEAVEGEPGICVFCGCTEDDACIGKDGDPCSWIDDDEETCCSACAETLAEAIGHALMQGLGDADSHLSDLVAAAVLAFLRGETS